MNEVKALWPFTNLATKRISQLTIHNILLPTQSRPAVTMDTFFVRSARSNMQGSAYLLQR